MKVILNVFPYTFINLLSNILINFLCHPACFFVVLIRKILANSPDNLDYFSNHAHHSIADFLSFRTLSFHNWSCLSGWTRVVSASRSAPAEEAGLLGFKPIVVARLNINTVLLHKTAHRPQANES